MKLSMITAVVGSAICVLFAQTVGAAAVPNVNVNIFDETTAGLARAPMRFTGSLVPGGPSIDFLGTISGVLPKLMELYPDWRPELDPVTSPNPGQIWSALGKRYFKGVPFCGQIPYADLYTIVYHGIPYVNALGNIQCEIPVATCSPIFCAPSPKSSIVVCNDRQTVVKVPCYRVAEAATVITDACAFNENKNVCGKWYNTDGYTVFVTSAFC